MPVPRLFLVASMAAALAVPVGARAQSRRDDATDGPSLRVAGLVGLDRGDWDGLALRLDGELDLQRIAPSFVLAGVGSFGYSNLSADFATYHQNLDLFTLVPAVRFDVRITPELGVYGDVGLGVYLLHATTHFDNGLSGDDTDFGFVARLGGGGYVWATDAIRFQAEIAANPRFNSNFNDTSVTFLLGAALLLR